MIFKGKVALITGGSRGIGKAIALELASRGADIAFNYFRGHDAATEAQREIEELGVRCLKMKAHLGEKARIEEMFSLVKDEYGRLDFLINNAASGVQRTAAELDEKHWDWTFGINAKAPWLCSIEASKLMADGGAIVFQEYGFGLKLKNGSLRNGWNAMFQNEERVFEEWLE